MKLPWISRRKHERIVKHYEQTLDARISWTAQVELTALRMMRECAGAHRGIARLQRKIKKLMKEENMKRVLLLALVLGGCDISWHHIEWALKVCKPFGELRYANDWTQSAECADGTFIYRPTNERKNP